MIKALLWDNDGVLVDTEKLFYKATRDTLSTVGIHLSVEKFIEFSLVKGAGLWSFMKDSGFSHSQCEDLRNSRNRLYASLLSEQSLLIEGVPKVLEQLSTKFKMAIVTSSRLDHFEIIHRSTMILHHFEFVLTSDDYSKTKPNPEPYLLGLKKIGFKSDECLVIEDSARGLTSANKAGMKCLMIPNDLSKPETYKGDYILLDSVKEVASTVACLNSN